MSLRPRESPLKKPSVVFLEHVCVDNGAAAGLLDLRAAAAALLLLYSAVQPNRWCPMFNATNGEHEDLNFLSRDFTLMLLLNFASSPRLSSIICPGPPAGFSQN